MHLHGNNPNVKKIGAFTKSINPKLVELEKYGTKKLVEQKIHKYSYASIRIQTIIHKYAKFLIYIARVHVTKIALSAIYL